MSRVFASAQTMSTMSTMSTRSSRIALAVLVALALLPAYGLLEYLRAYFWGTNVRVISPATHPSILMWDYYAVVYPAAFLVAAAVRRRAKPATR